jgi:hypothetical protein
VTFKPNVRHLAMSLLRKTYLNVILDTMCDSHAQYASLARSHFLWFPMYPASALAAALREYI